MSLGRVLVFLVIAVGGLAMAGAGGNMILNEQSDVRQAVTAEGTVQSTDVENTGGFASTADRPATSGWLAVVNYTYTHDGREYSSESVYPGPERTFKFEAGAMAVANQVSPGQTVTVYVNRQNPSRAFLIRETGGNPAPLFLLGIGSLVGVPFLLAVGKELRPGGDGS